MASSVLVYGPSIPSASVSRVLACLIEKDVEFQVVNVELSKGQHKLPQHLQIQPFGQVPVYQDEEIILFESRAICRYVSEKYKNQGNTTLFGTNPLTKASIDQWLEAEGQNFNPPTSALIFQLAFVPMMKLEQDPNMIKQSEGKLTKVLDVYEHRLGDNRYLAGEEFTLADLSHLPLTQYLLNRTDRGELITSRKNVGRWWAEISGRHSWKKVTEMQNATPKV